MTIVQPNVEIGVLTNRIIFAPPMPCYSSNENTAPLFRDIVSGLIDRLQLEPEENEHMTIDTEPRRVSDGANGSGMQDRKPSQLLGTGKIESVYPQLQSSFKASLIAETVHALAAVGGHDNPPARHIVGFEGVASVKEKLKTVSEELEDFIEVSSAVDLEKGEEPVGMET